MIKQKSNPLFCELHNLPSPIICEMTNYFHLVCDQCFRKFSEDKNHLIGVMLNADSVSYFIKFSNLLIQKCTRWVEKIKYQGYRHILTQGSSIPIAYSDQISSTTNQVVIEYIQLTRANKNFVEKIPSFQMLTHPDFLADLFRLTVESINQILNILLQRLKERLINKFRREYQNIEFHFNQSIIDEISIARIAMLSQYQNNIIIQIESKKMSPTNLDTKQNSLQNKQIKLSQKHSIQELPQTVCKKIESYELIYDQPSKQISQQIKKLKKHIKQLKDSEERREDQVGALMKKNQQLNNIINQLTKEKLDIQNISLKQKNEYLAEIQILKMKLQSKEQRPNVNINEQLLVQVVHLEQQVQSKSYDITLLTQFFNELCNSGKIKKEQYTERMSTLRTVNVTNSY